MSRPDTQSTNKTRIIEERKSNAEIRPESNTIDETPDRNQINNLEQYDRVASIVNNDPQQMMLKNQDAELLEGESIGSYLIFKLDERLFKFRGQVIPAGQYEFPFSFLIPEKKIPSSFHYISAVGESFSVKYTI